MVKSASNRCLQAAVKALASVDGKKMLLPQELFLGSGHSPGRRVRGAGGEDCIIWRSSSKRTDATQGTLDTPSVLARLTPKDLAQNFKLQLARRADNSVPLYEHGNRTPKVTVLLSLIQQTKNTLLTFIILSRTLILFSRFSPVSSSTSRRHGRQIFILAHNFLSQVGPSLISSSFVANEPQWKARSDWYGICEEDPKLCTDSSSQNMH
jgi:hypothetical protein